MSKGKYSPVLPHCNDDTAYRFNCYGNLPTKFVKGEVEYDGKTMFDNFDDEGFDRYGYSSFDADGNFVGFGDGVDRLGYTELEYMCMDDDTFYNL